MKKYSNLENAPIEQAIIAVDVEPSKQLEHLAGIVESLKGLYPTNQKVNRKSVFVTDDNVTAQNFQEGYALNSDDKKKEVNINLSRIAFRDADKYIDFDNLISQYESIWNIYLQTGLPEKLSRIGLRYVNKFFMTPEDVESNLLIKPFINSGDDGMLLLGELFAQYAVRSDLYKANGNVFIVTSPQVDGKLQITFDIDVFDQSIPYVDFNSIKDTLNRLRGFKNKLFFENILDAVTRFKK